MSGRPESGLTAEIQEVVVLQAVDSLELTTDVELLGGRKQVLDTWVGVIVATENLDGLLNPVARLVSN